jgi:hypothetical protein
MVENPANSDSAVPMKKRLRLQFSLQTMFIVVTVAALLCAIAVKWRAVRDRREADYQRTKRAMEEGGGVRPIFQHPVGVDIRRRYSDVDGDHGWGGAAK